MVHPGSSHTQDTARKFGRFRWLAGGLFGLLIVAALGIFAWRYVLNPCEVHAVKEASAFLLSQSKRYDSVYRVTADASQSSVLLPVTVLQQISLDTQETDVPACMQTAKNELTNYMRTVIRAFQAYAAGETNAAVIDLIHQSDSHYSNFAAELDVVNKCAPFCIP